MIQAHSDLAAKQMCMCVCVLIVTVKYQWQKP